ncbi:MAG: hypothetical protein PVK00_01385 [Flavobacteriales bacterium]|jgi:hypothetical protein
MKKLVPLLAIALLLSGCRGAQYYYKSGNKYAKAHMLKESVTAYKQAIDRKPGRVKYRMAMDQQGNALLEELYTNYRFADGNDSLSIYKFLEAEKWRNYLKPYINTSLYEGFYDRDYADQLDRFLSQKYIRAEKWIRTRQFDRAQSNLEEIKSLDPNYKEVQSLLEFSEVEPVYVQALDLFEGNKFREVHELLQPMLKKYPKQEMLRKLEEQAIERGKYRLGIISDPNITGSEATMSAALQSAVISLIQKNNDPFLELLDRTNFEMLQQEQEAIINGTTNEAAVTQELLAADAYLKVIITHVYENEGTLNQQTRRGWERYYVTTKNDEGEEVKKAMYKKVTYREFTKKNEASYDMQLAMVERATSKILWSESFHHEDKDEIHYVEFSGTGDLFSGDWRYQNKEHPSDRRRNDSGSMNRLVKANKRIQSTSSMRKDAISNLAQKAAAHVNQQKLTKE